MLNLTEPTCFKQFAPVLFVHDGGNHTSNSQQFICVSFVHCLIMVCKIASGAHSTILPLFKFPSPPLINLHSESPKESQPKRHSPIAVCLKEQLTLIKKKIHKSICNSDLNKFASSHSYISKRSVRFCSSSWTLKESMVSKLKLEDCATKVYSISSATNCHGFSRNLEAQEALHGWKERGRRAKKFLQICDRMSTKLMVDFMCILSSHNC